MLVPHGLLISVASLSSLPIESPPSLPHSRSAARAEAPRQSCGGKNPRDPPPQESQSREPLPEHTGAVAQSRCNTRKQTSHDDVRECIKHFQHKQAILTLICLVDTAPRAGPAGRKACPRQASRPSTSTSRAPVAVGLILLSRSAWRHHMSIRRYFQPEHLGLIQNAALGGSGEPDLGPWIPMRFLDFWCLEA